MCESNSAPYNALWAGARRRDIVFRRAAIGGYLIGATAFVAAVATGHFGVGWDAGSYWNAATGHPYEAVEGVRGAFVYSPPIAQLLTLLRPLGPNGIAALVAALSLASLLYVAGPWAVLFLLVPQVEIELLMGNINLILGAAIVLGFRHPGAWALVLLTKVTPGVGLLWFVVRSDGRSLARALVPTIAIVLMSFAVAPGWWRAWAGVLLDSAKATPLNMSIGIPLLPRVSIAALLAVWGGATFRPQTVVVAAWLALPVLWGQTEAMLIACLPLIGPWGVVFTGLPRVSRGQGQES
ncbi:MAG: glycosyltransferase family 87 protein [Candidatus Limnocylindrales bacterium]